MFIIIYIGSLLAFPSEDFYRFGKVSYSLVMLVPTFLVPILFYKGASHKEPYAVYLIFTVIAVSSSTLWGGIKHAFLEIAIPYYPFDLLIGVFCCALFWFKRFYHTAEERIQLNEKLQRANKTKDDFLANTSHELRNPLHAMMNIAQSLLGTPLPEDAKSQVQVIESVARKMSYTLQDLTDISALREGHVQLLKQPVDLYGLVDYIFDVLVFSKEGKAITFHNQVPADFPLVEADENRLIQILFNFIQNALKFTERGTVTVSAYEKGGQAFVSIQDTGIGMDEETQERVFQPYEQADSSVTSAGGGIGLGLSICVQLIELHEGALSVSSSPGEGSLFTFSLPMSNRNRQKSGTKTKQEKPEKTEKTEKTAVVIPRPSNVKKSEWVLLVDDDPVNLSILTRMLEKEGYTVKACLNGEEALSRLYGQRWDIIISDVMMPRMSGYELTVRIREKFSLSELPILLLTARGKIEDIQAGFQAGANDYVLKPVEKAELMARVSSLLQLKRSLKKQASIEAALLQAQMNPHFLYNTLNTIVALSEIDPDKMTRLLHEFGNYLQKSFDRGNLQETVTIQSELNLIQSYLYIEQQRFGERLLVDWNIEEDSLHMFIPPLSIQTLIENAVRHGMAEQASQLKVSLFVKKVKEGTQVVIEDNGAGIDQEKIKMVLEGTNQGGIGLYNTNKRLVQLYGRGLTIQRSQTGGTKVSFLLPNTQDANRTVS